MRASEKKLLFERIYHALTEEGYDTPLNNKKGLAVFKDYSISDELDGHSEKNPCIFWLTHGDIYNQRAAFKHCNTNYRKTCVFVRADYVDWANMIVSMVVRYHRHNLKHVFDTPFLTKNYINFDDGNTDEYILGEDENPFETIFLAKFPEFKKLLKHKNKKKYDKENSLKIPA